VNDWKRPFATVRRFASAVRRTVANFLLPVRATFLCVVWPSSLVDLARENDPKALPQHQSSTDKFVFDSAHKICRAFWFSWLLTVGFASAGYAVGCLLRIGIQPASLSLVKGLQIGSAAILLVATLAARGWEIQTYNGDTLVEKVNKWLTRSLFVIGTFLFALSLGWTR
jgi:hypothetical protein